MVPWCLVFGLSGSMARSSLGVQAHRIGSRWMSVHSRQQTFWHDDSLEDFFHDFAPVCKTHPEMYDPSTLDPDVSVWIDHDIFGWTWGKVLQIKVARFVDKVESTHQDGISHQQDRLNAIIVCWTSVTLTCNRLPSYDSESIQMCSKKDRCMHRQLCTHMLKYSDSYIIQNQNWI